MNNPRYDQLLVRYKELGKVPATAAPHAPARAAVAGPTPVHVAAVELLHELLAMVPSDAQPFSGIVRNMRHLEPLLLRDFAKVPPENVALWLHELGAKMIHAADAYTGQPARTDDEEGERGGLGSDIAARA